MCILSKTLYACACAASSKPTVTTFCALAEPPEACPRSQTSNPLLTPLRSAPQTPGTISACLSTSKSFCCSATCCSNSIREAQTAVQRAMKALEKAKGKVNWRRSGVGKEEREFWEKLEGVQREEHRHRECERQRGEGRMQGTKLDVLVDVEEGGAGRLEGCAMPAARVVA